MTAPQRPSWKTLFWGGLLPVIAFTVIEEKYGTWWGLIAGLAFGGGEIVWELWKHKKVSTITWIGNGLLLALGVISLLTNDGLWFKMQPAIFEALFALALWGSLLRGKNLLLWLAEKQGATPPPEVQSLFPGLTFRLGLFFAFQAVLAVHAALHWSTEAWAILKGVGLTLSLLLYFALEVLYLRSRQKR